VSATTSGEAGQTRRIHRRWRRDAYWVVGVSSLSVGVALLLYQVWNANLHLPLGHNFDMRVNTAMVKGLGQNGWWVHNPRLGAPFGQDMSDFPASGRTSELVVLRAIRAVVDSPGLAVNVYFFAGFAILAAVAFLVFRRIGLSPPMAAALAIAYDFLPFHFYHGPDHLTHSTYFTAPLGVLLLVRVLEPKIRILRSPRDAARRPYFGPSGSVRAGPLAVLCAIAIVIGCSGEMIATFTIVLLVVGGLLAAIATRRVSRLAFALLLAATIVVVFLLVSLPTLLHVLDVGKNPIAAKRQAFESDLYGLHPALMLLPTPQHWITALGSFARTAVRGNPLPGEGGQAIGTLGAIGVFAAIGGVLVHSLRNGSNRSNGSNGSNGRGSHRQPAPPAAMPLAIVIVLAILLGSGGATFLDVVSGFTQIRTWNWIVVMIAFAAFARTGFACERLLRWIRARAANHRVRLAATLTMVIIVAGVGILDGGRPPLPDQKSITAEWVSDQAFVSAMHTVQPSNGMIFEFPVVRFPESPPIARMQDYDQLRGYLADKGDFHWSYGAVKGRPQADWQLKVPKIPTATDLRALIGLGFTGLWLNRDGYPDYGRTFESHLLPMLGRPTLVSQNRRLVFYDLRPFASRSGPEADLAAEARARFGITAPRAGPQTNPRG
jgi:phosphoglycerol transferase